MEGFKGQATPEQIAAWKKEVAGKYGENAKVYEYKVDDSVAYLRSVDRNTFSLASSKVASAGPNKFNEVILENIWLGGDDAVRKEDRYYFALIEFIEELLGKKKGSLSEL